MIKRRKIGIFGGSFDPPHNGHIAAVCSAIEILNLDCVYVIPTGQNPLKEMTASADIRFDLAKLAFQDVPKVTVLGCEIDREAPSYTVDTVQWLIDHDDAFKDAERYLLIGNDLVSEIEKWRECKQLFELVIPVVLARGDESIKRDDVQYISTPRFDISSTEIRSRVRKGQYCNHLMPSAVLSLIQKLQLYRV